MIKTICPNPTCNAHLEAPSPGTHRCPYCGQPMHVTDADFVAEISPQYVPFTAWAKYAFFAAMLVLTLDLIAGMTIVLTIKGRNQPSLVFQGPAEMDQPDAKKEVLPKKEDDRPKNFTNAIGMKFVWIAPGSFMMGSPKEEKERAGNENQYKVTLTKGFYMGVYTVTQAQYETVMGSNPSHFQGEKNLPVENVTWNECQEFIKKLQGKDKNLYRLPTEAEWVYACRAGTTTPFHFGETISTDQANYNGDLTYGDGKKGVNRRKTMPVGSFPANAWGLHDMHGNVFQWCQDWYDDYPRKDVVDPQGPNTGKLRVLSGGSWISSPRHCRSAFRYGYVPGRRYHDIGFRLCFGLDDALCSLLLCDGDR